MWAHNKERVKDRYYHVHPQLLYRIHISRSLVVDDFLHIALFILFAPFVRYRFLPCSLTCTLTPPVIFIMERVLPTVYFVIRSCNFCTTLAAFLTLFGANFYKLLISGKRYKIPIHGKCLQILALLFKLILDLIPVILTALNILKTTLLEDGKSEACLSSRHKVIDGLTDRNHSVYRLHPALLYFYVHNKL